MDAEDGAAATGTIPTRVGKTFGREAWQRIGEQTYRGRWIAVVREIRSNYGHAPGSAAFTHELVAKAFRDGRHNVPLWRRFLDAVVSAWRASMRRLGFAVRLSDSEVRNFIHGLLRAEATARRSSGGRAEAAPAWRRALVPAPFRPKAPSGRMVPAPAFAAKGEDFSESAKRLMNMRRVRGSDQARAAASEFLNLPLTNRDSGVTATVSGESLGKMMSRIAVEASVSVQAHMQAIGNLDRLFPEALRRIFRSGRLVGDPAKTIHHFDVPMPFDGEVLRVKIMAKEYERPETGTRLYLVQAVKIEKPASIGGVRPRLTTESAPVSVPPAGFDKRFARFAAKVKEQMGSMSVDGERGSQASTPQFAKGARTPASGDEISSLRAELDRAQSALAEAVRMAKQEERQRAQTEIDRLQARIAAVLEQSRAKVRAEREKAKAAVKDHPHARG